MSILLKNLVRQGFRREISSRFCLLSSSSDESIDFPSDLADKAAITNNKRDQTRKAFRPAVDPSLTSILLFPGQGAQFVGMGKQLADNKNAADLFSIASDILRYDLLKVCLEGPLDLLNRTEICQVATLVTSLAALEDLRERTPQALDTCVAAAGFSVGEYAALAFAGAISFEDAVQLVKIRGQQMQAAADAQPSGLMTVFLQHDSKLKTAMVTARRYCQERCNIEEPVCDIANYLFADAKVIGGHEEALDFIRTNYREFNLKRVKMLPVSGAFHTALMKPAALNFKTYLDKATLRAPVVPVHSNVNGAAYRSVPSIKRGLERQIYQPVKWEQLMHTLYHRPQNHAFPNTYEVGPGSQLGTILKVVNRKAYQTCTSVAV